LLPSSIRPHWQKITSSFARGTSLGITVYSAPQEHRYRIRSSLFIWPRRNRVPSGKLVLRADSSAKPRALSLPLNSSLSLNSLTITVHMEASKCRRGYVDSDANGSGVGLFHGYSLANFWHADLRRCTRKNPCRNALSWRERADWPGLLASRMKHNGTT
jgi:hypothetical protein